jgi:hypothetical protein
VEQIFLRSEGQPLLVVSLVDDLIARQEIVEVEGSWHLSLQTAASQTYMSPGLREMIGSQIDRLTADATAA